MTRTQVRSGARLIKAIAAFVVLLAVIIGVPVVLAAIGAVPHGLPTAHQIGHSLASQDTTGQYFRIAGALFVWIAWAVFTVGTVKEAAASIRLHGPRPSMPRHGLRRLGPAAMVATIAVLFVAGPTALTLTAPHASAAPAPHSPLSSVSAPLSAAPTQHTATAPSTARTATTAYGNSVHGTNSLPTYEVQRYDTLWSIAAKHLPGDPVQRYRDIKALNPTMVGPDNEIAAGKVLTLPADAYGLPVTEATAAGSGTEQVVVEPGETLSGIAEEHGISAWRSVWPENAGHLEPGGERFTNPNHIEPGWTVTMPGTGTTDVPVTPPTTQPHPSTPAHPLPPTSHPGNPGTPDPSTPPQTPSSPAATPTHAASEHAAASGEHAAHREGMDVWEAISAGGAALLAAGIFTTLLQHRRRQFRNRRPGRTISSAEPELIPAEKALITHGPAGLADVKFLDHALRSLSAATAEDPDARLPEVVAVRMVGDQLNVRLADAHPSPPPAPWTVDDSGCWWSVSVGDELPVSDDNAEQYLAPYPTLVAVGHEDSGARWLLDLESAGALALTGDPQRCLDLGRFIAAELAVNAWSDQLSVTMVGFGEDMVPLNPDRLRHTADLDSAAAALRGELATAVQASGNVGLDVLTARMRAVAGDSWMPHVLLIAPHIAQAEDGDDKLAQLLAALREQPDRSTVAVVLAGDQAHTPGAARQVSISAASRLNIPGLGLDMTVQQMPADHVAAFGRLLRRASRLEDEPMPASTGSRPYDRFIDAGGALLPEVTLPRVTASPAQPIITGGATSIVIRHATMTTEDADTERAEADLNRQAEEATSVLPHDDEDYLRVGATSSEELQALAPRVSAQRRAEILAADPTMDADLADWRDPDSPRPKLRLIGAIELTAAGVRPPKRISYYTEIAAFIGTRDHGATAEQVAAAFDVATSSIYSRINTVRAWLGTNPATGEKYLPDSTQSIAGKARGVGVYEFDGGVLVDADLFKRLRARAQALGGGEGLTYLQAALDLVAGQPFDQQRTGGYGWLAENTLEQHLVCGVVDAAHTACLAYMRAGDLPNARAVTEAAQLAAPYEDIPRLDLAEVMKAEGHGEEAERYLREEVCNRSEDSQAPDDIPERTEEVLRRRDWLSRAI
jgi:LysM repeat protein